jgi:hypothetical protein
MHCRLPRALTYFLSSLSDRYIGVVCREAETFSITIAFEIQTSQTLGDLYPRSSPTGASGTATVLECLKMRDHSHSESYTRARPAARGRGSGPRPGYPGAWRSSLSRPHPWAWYKTCSHTFTTRFLPWTLEEHDTRRGVLKVIKEAVVLCTRRSLWQTGGHKKPGPMSGPHA